MSGGVLVLRPVPGAAATARLAATLGLAATVAPLSAVVPEPWTVPDPESFDALLIGSANALRHAGEGLLTLRALPALVVGEATARAAREAGFTVAATGEGGLQNLLDNVAQQGGKQRLLRLAGASRVPLEPAHGQTIETRIVYRVAYGELSQAAVAALHDGAVALLHSGDAASHFAAECDRLGLDRSTISLAVLAPRVAGAAGQGWQAVAIAPRPSDGALLELVRDMCQ